MGAKRAAGLQRVLRLYSAVEQMHAVELHAASFAVSQAENAIKVAQRASLEASRTGRVALGEGDREEWMLAEARQEIVGIRRERMEEVKVEREAVREAAREVFDQSRVRAEQMKQVVGKMREDAERHEARQMQAASDDRFLMRSRWRAGKDERR